MRDRKLTTRGVAGAFAALLAASAWSASPEVDDDADRILREMGEYLRTANEYTFRADIAYDEIVDDQMILFGGVSEIALHRDPDRLNVELDSDLIKRRLVFDGETITMHNRS